MVARLAVILALIAAAGAEAAAEQLVGRTRVVDGDTIVVGGITVRLKGFAAPEVARFDEPRELGGEEAAAFMRDLAEERIAVYELIQERTHGRRVGYCAVGGVDLGESIVAAGLARDCSRFSGGRHAAVEPAAAADLPFPRYCRQR